MAAAAPTLPPAAEIDLKFDARFSVKTVFDDGTRVHDLSDANARREKFRHSPLVTTC